MTKTPKKEFKARIFLKNGGRDVDSVSEKALDTYGFRVTFCETEHPNFFWVCFLLSVPADYPPTRSACGVLSDVLSGVGFCNELNEVRQ